MDRALRHPARDPRATPTTSPTASTSAATSSSTRGSSRPTFDEADQPLDGRAPTDGDEVTARVPDHGHRAACPRPTLPDIPGRDTFAGRELPHRSWPHEGVDFTGQRVGVIGTGSSAIQSIPIIAEAGGRAHRVPAHRQPTRCRRRTSRSTPSERAEIKADYAEFRAANRRCRPRSAARRPTHEQSALEVVRGGAPGRVRGALGRRRPAVPRRVHRPALRQGRPTTPRPSSSASKIREIVEGSRVAELLTPDTVVGCKRLCVDTGYFETFNRPQRAPRRPERDADRGDHARRAPHDGDRQLRARRASSSPPASTP